MKLGASEPMGNLEVMVGEALRQKGLTVSCAESCTGGLLTSRLTDVPGSSDYVLGSVVSYSCEVKERLVHVRHETLQHMGAVSEETAREMAEGIRETIGADIGVGITGLAGPGSDEPGKPVGLVYISVSGRNGTIVEENHFHGNRAEIKHQSTEKALEMLQEYVGRISG